MKVTFEHSELLNALNLINGICGASNVLPILSCVLIRAEAGAVEITGNNLEISVEVKTPAVLETEGMIAIPAKRLLALVKELPKDDPITFEAYGDDNQDGEVGFDKLRITFGGDYYGSNTYNLIGLDADEYPMRSEIEGETFKMICSDLQSVLRQTEFAASTDQIRWNLNGIYFNEREVVATDSNIMAKVACPVVTPKFILPLTAIKELRKTFKELDSYVTVKVSKGMISFATDDVRLTSRLIEAEYAHYWSVIPPKYWITTPTNEDIEPLVHTNSVTVSKSEIYKAVRRVSIFASDKNGLLILAVVGNEIRLSCDDVESGNSAAWIRCSDSEDVRLGLNAFSLLEILSRIDGDSLTIEFGNPLSAIVIKSSDTDQFIYIMMPMRLEE